MISIPQKDWLRALTAHPDAVLIGLANRLSQHVEISMLQLPQAGLGIINFKESAFNESFFLGEIPLSSCSVKIKCHSGTECTGSAQIMADNAELAKALAILDGFLAYQLPEWEQALSLLTSGVQKRKLQDQQRKNILSKTHVDFTTLDQSDTRHAN